MKYAVELFFIYCFIILRWISKLIIFVASLLILCPYPDAILFIMYKEICMCKYSQVHFHIHIKTTLLSVTTFIYITAYHRYKTSLKVFYRSSCIVCYSKYSKLFLIQTKWGKIRVKLAEILNHLFYLSIHLSSLRRWVKYTVASQHSRHDL